MKTRALTLHFALFFKNTIERPDIEFSGLNSQMLNIFDAMPRIIPIPKDLPADIPLMTLSSENGVYQCNIARSRIDFILNRTSEDKTNNDLLKDFNAKISGFAKACINTKEISRFGIVARYFIQDNNPFHTLRKKYFTSIVDGSTEISLRYTKKSDYCGFTINDILEISAAEAITNGVIEKGIYIQRDINNTEIPGKNITYETLEKISKEYSNNIGENEITGLIK